MAGELDMSKRFCREGCAWSVRYVGPRYFIRLRTSIGLLVLANVLWTTGMYWSRFNKDIDTGYAIVLGPAVVLLCAGRLRRWWEAPLITFCQFGTFFIADLTCYGIQHDWYYVTETIAWERVIILGAASVLGSLFIWLITKLVRGAPIIGENRCPICTYLLIGNVSGRCPECGHDIALKIPPVAPG